MLLVFLSVTKLNIAFCQSFYEIKWSDPVIDYSALVIYYSENEITVRVKYENKEGEKKVAEYKCKEEIKFENGVKYLIYDGYDARTINSSHSSDKKRYSADNFLFKDINNDNEFDELYTIDDEQLKKENFVEYIKPASFRKLIPSDAFREKYLIDFFNKNETVYQELVKNYIEDKVENNINYAITDLGYGSDSWFVVMTKGTSLKKQLWKRSTVFPKEWIAEKWDKNFNITSVAFGDEEWIVTMSKGADYKQVYSSITEDYPKNWVNDKLEKDYYITSVAYGNGKWVVIMSKGTIYTDQVLSPVSEDYPAEWVREMRSESFQITSLAYGNQGWIVVMSKGTGFTNQVRSAINKSYPKEWINEKWKDDYDITSIAYGKDGWVVVMSKGYNYHQSYNTKTNYPSSWISSKWGDAVQQPISETANTKMHVIIVSDTNDPDIGQSCNNDMFKISALLNKVSAEINGLDLEIKQIFGKDLKKSKIIDAINNLSVFRNDIVMFYYTGHGYNNNPELSEFPTMSLSGDDYKLNEVYELIQSKRPRLNLVFGDLCNSIPGTRIGTGRGGEIAFRSSAEFDYKKLSRLFLKSKGSLITTSSSYSEYSFSIPDGGSRGYGAFTKSFVDAFLMDASIISDSQGDWRNILSQAYNLALRSTKGYKNANGKYGQRGFNEMHIDYSIR